MCRVRFYSQYIIFTKRFLSGMLENRRCGFSYFDDLPFSFMFATRRSKSL